MIIFSSYKIFPSTQALHGGRALFALLFAVLAFAFIVPAPLARAAVAITDVLVSNVTASSAVISWKSGAAGDSWVGFAPQGGTQKSVTDLKQVTFHSMTLTGLSPATMYTYEVNTQTLSGDIGYIAGLTFTTLGQGIGGSAYPCGQLAKSGAGIYFLTGKDKVKIPFTSMAAFTGLGYNLKNVKTLDVSDYRSSGGYYLSSPTQEHPWCSWMKWKDGTVYYSHPSGAIPVPSWDVFLNNGGRADLIVPMNAADDAVWAKNPNLLPLQMNDSRML